MVTGSYPGSKTAAAHTAVTAVIRYCGTIDFGRLIYAAVTLDWTDLHEVSSTLDDWITQPSPRLTSL